jgi:hypothetical protein
MLLSEKRGDPPSNVPPQPNYYYSLISLLTSIALTAPDLQKNSLGEP